MEHSDHSILYIVMLLYVLKELLCQREVQQFEFALKLTIIKYDYYEKFFFKEVQKKQMS